TGAPGPAATQSTRFRSVFLDAVDQAVRRGRGDTRGTRGRIPEALTYLTVPVRFVPRPSDRQASQGAARARGRAVDRTRQVATTLVSRRRSGWLKPSADRRGGDHRDDLLHLVGRQRR